MTDMFIPCERTDLPLDMCNCDLCAPEIHGTAQHHSTCGCCAARIQPGDPITKPAGERRWWHQQCAEDR